MNLTLNYAFIRGDLNRIVSSRFGRRSYFIRGVAFTIVVTSGFRHLLNAGFDWLFIVFVLIAMQVAVPCFILRIVIWCCYLVCGRPKITVAFDDVGFSVKTQKGKQDCLWWSFGMTGRATEADDHFFLEWGNGSLWIPKRAFAGEEELLSFRSIISEKIGDRCQFNTTSTKVF